MLLRGPKLWVNLILNVILVRFRLIGTHFDHYRYKIRIFIFWFFYRSLWSHAKVSDPPYRGVPEFCFQKLLFQFVDSNPFHDLEVGKKVKSKFSNLSPLPNTIIRCNITNSTLFHSVYNWSLFILWLSMCVQKQKINILKKMYSGVRKDKC